ncbi:VOC family protein [Acuticoccus sp. MNP-M23]|uniref:VOC family protein n=1 Tax=Acuticoccus sp. MNP-M23 TaxID=3072793 RepID=UPI002814A876|nr:VOC family protein [Acuticoccus sp. MNP-M23]WMS41928.1 VOC family protein [Acuticoccus sp. MNP-M23]
MTAIAAIRLVSRNADRLAAFYRNALGFLPADEGMVEDPFVGRRRLLGLTLGAERIEILEVDGAPPATGAGPDTAFQHFAMVAPDINAAMNRLAAAEGWSAISTNGPQILPASSGGVTAFKFCDPEGHPLEFLSFPVGQVPPAWQGRAGDGLLGIDHTAIVVADTAASLAAYAALGFRPEPGTHNRGVEQDRLDGVAGADVVVTPLVPETAPPHLELLCYRPAAAVPLADDDLRATRTILAGAGNGPWRDPDGHRWISAATGGATGLQLRQRQPGGHGGTVTARMAAHQR